MVEPADEPIDHPVDDELFERLENRLEALGVLVDPSALRGPAEQAMISTLAARDVPLADREGFVRAHRALARALEAILGAGRDAPVLPRRLGVVRPLAAPLVQLVAGWIVAGQTNDVSTEVQRLYALREANAEWGSADHRVLRRCRKQMQHVTADLGASRLGLPLFLLSGAFLSAVLSAIRAVVAPVLGSAVLTAVLAVTVAVVLAVTTGTVLQAASTAKMRLRIALVAPLHALYDAVGSAGDPPRDRCFAVAVGALVLFGVTVVALLVGFVLLQHR